MLTHATLIAFIATEKPDQARRFYEETLGLRLIEDTEFAFVFDAGGTMLRVQKVPEWKPSQGTVLGWRVRDLESFAQRLMAHDVRPERYPYFAQDDFGIWHTPDGSKVLWFKDPDDNTLSLTEFG